MLKIVLFFCLGVSGIILCCPIQRRSELLYWFFFFGKRSKTGECYSLNVSLCLFFLLSIADTGQQIGLPVVFEWVQNNAKIKMYARDSSRAVVLDLSSYHCAYH